MQFTQRVRCVSMMALLSLGTACGGGAVSGSNNASIPSVPLGALNASLAPNVLQSCATPLPGDNMRCYAEFRTDVTPANHPLLAGATTVAGYGPADLDSAYRLSAAGGNGQTVAVVDAYDDPYAARDLNVYRAHFHLPACTTATRCFRQVGQTGGALPAHNAGWAQEISLDVDMVSAVCPRCRILLIEASSAADTNLAIAVDEAVKLGATEISNSYGGPEFAPSSTAYNHPGVIITASAGDGGTGAAQPCSFASVVCVGGTSLSRATNVRRWTESAWSGTGSGCSAYVTKPSWQHDRGCRRRSEVDASAVGDPNTGVAVYDSYAFQGFSGWLIFGGTSASSPIIAATYALAGNARSLNAAQSLWQHLGTSALNDVRSGSNGVCPRLYPYICNAGAGYDGPTGVGTPNGTAAF